LALFLDLADRFGLAADLSLESVLVVTSKFEL
jgi:hypothetical protein